MSDEDRKRYIAMGREMGKRICEALGIDASNVTDVRILCSASVPARVQIDRQIENREATRVIDILEDYVLTAYAKVPVHLAEDEPEHTSPEAVAAFKEKLKTVKKDDGPVMMDTSYNFGGRAAEFEGED